MENKAKPVGIVEKVRIDQTDTPAFFRLYKESILLALLEQGLIDEAQFQICIDELSHGS